MAEMIAIGSYDFAKIFQILQFKLMKWQLAQKPATFAKPILQKKAVLKIRRLFFANIFGFFAKFLAF